MIDALRLTGTETVLDAGCGTGADAMELAERAGRVVGVDVSEALIAEARRRAEGTRCSTPAAPSGC
jgi:ubiquinone/menaquinone biosynthesis C-methylase UbiE